MRPSPLPAIAVVLLVLAGCAGIPGTGDSGPSPGEFPDASAIDQSVYERHAALLANTSFTVRFETTEKRPDPHPRESGNFTWLNSSQRVLVEPGASQYLSQPNGTIDYLGASTVQSAYSNGTRTFWLTEAGNESTVQTGETRLVFDESGDYYLWQGWAEFNRLSLYHYISENVTFQRTGIETFAGVDVMRYEATGADALTGRLRDPSSYNYTDFSVTLLLDADGVIRYYQAEVDIERDERGFDRMQNLTLVSTVTDVGSTDVERPDWASNATVGS